jgi:putative oxidoreductase
MIGLRGVARTLLAGIFVFGGLSAWKRSSTLAGPAGKLVEPIRDRIPGSPTSEQLVKVNAGVQVSAAGLFALGVAPRVMAVVLGASLVPTTLAGHRFWESDDEAAAAQHKTHALKNAALVGGLIFAALDTGGRPSVFWSGRRALGGLADNVSTTVSSTSHSIADRLPTS